MALRPWKTLSERTIDTNPFWRYQVDEFELPNGRTGRYYYASTHGAALVIPVTAEGHIVMVAQYRYLMRCDSIEFPCGGVKPGATREQTAREELREEAGYEASEWLELGLFNPMNGITNEMCGVYLARGLRYVGTHPDDTEEFEQLKLTPAQINDGVRQGKIQDGMTLAAWTMAIASGLLTGLTGSSAR